MKKQILLIFIVVFGISFAGCISAIPEMSPEEEALVTTYMADLLLKYDKNYQSAYMDEEEVSEAIVKEEAGRIKAEEIKKAEEAAKKAEEEENTPEDIVVEENPVSGDITNLSEYLDMAGATVEYLGYETVTRYPDTDEIGFAMTPTDGNELVVLKFNMVNLSSSDLEVDMMSKDHSFVVYLNNTRHVVLNTFLENDISLFQGVLPIETGQELVMIIEKPSGETIKTMELEVYAPSRDLHKRMILK